MSTKPLTPEQIKEQFRAKGISLADWAEQNGYHRNSVYRVLNGVDRAYRGKAHEIAVKLGMKLANNSSAA